MDNHRRQLRPISRRCGSRIWVNQREYIDFSSNDYLGYAGGHGFDSPPHTNSGAAGSRLLGGDYTWTHDLESDLAHGLGHEAALIFNSGYQLAVGLVPVLVGPGDMVFADRCIHASWIDGIRLSGARFIRFSHNHLMHLSERLQRWRGLAKRAIIVVESVYSMDGDSPDFSELIRLARLTQSRLIVDEAHALGVYGERGMGRVGGTAFAKDVDFITGTFGKALGGFGAYVAGSAVDMDQLIQSCRSFIYSTALPPSLIQQNHLAFNRMQSESAKRARLMQYGCWIRLSLQQLGYAVSLDDSPIIPIKTGTFDRAKALAELLREAGFWCLPIGHPTVLRDDARVRISLSAAHQESDIHGLVAAIPKIGHY